MSELTIPCAYQGGKYRIAKQIVNIISEYIKDDNTKFYDLCCGSGAVSIELVNQGFNPENIHMVDKSPWGLFWKMIGNRTFDIKIFKKYVEDVPKDKFKIQKHIKDLYKNPTYDNLVYEFLLLQATSFGSKSVWWENDKWCTSSFRNYWQPNGIAKRTSPVNPMIPMPEVIYERVKGLCENLKGIKGYWDNCDDIYIEPNSIIYIDPPYINTSGYGFNFNYMNFINLHKNNNIIFLSEGIKLSDNAIQISGERKKGGINGNRKTKNDEWLNIFKRS